MKAATPDVANPAELERVRRLVAEVIAQGSGRAAESVEADLGVGRSFDPVGAVEYGLADRVVE